MSLISSVSANIIIMLSTMIGCLLVTKLWLCMSLIASLSLVIDLQCITKITVIWREGALRS